MSFISQTTNDTTMVETSTQTDLIRLLYSETSTDESSDIMHHIAEEEELDTLNKDLQTVKAHLNTLAYTPPASVTHRLLQYSKYAK